MPIEFMLPGDTRIGALADFYGLGLDAHEATRRLDQCFAAHYEGDPRPGDRIELGPARLVVRDVVDGRVACVGLGFDREALRAVRAGEPSRASRRGHEAVVPPPP